MKKYEVFRNIRKGAIIMGLPISLFALMMASVIGSLLIIIFSFSLGIILSVLVFNIALYIVLTHITRHAALIKVHKAFPHTISNKKLSPFSNEED